MHRIRLDQLLVQRGLAESREKARALILTGKVRVAGTRVDKASALVPSDTEIAGIESLPYVSRGGLKLAHALDVFQVDVRDRLALDAGASTGGFTDVLLQRGAGRVYAVDVGYGQLAWKLRTDPRVVCIERTNVRYLESLPEPVDLAAADLSFISLTLVLEPLQRLAAERADFIMLIKPQFEAGRERVGKGGVVRDSAVHHDVLRSVVAHAERLGLLLHGLTASPVLGPAGNTEFLGWFRSGAAPSLGVEACIDRALTEAQDVRARAGQITAQ